MLSQKNMTKKKLENMHLQERIDHGYRTVIRMMLISGLFSIVVIGILFANMQHHIKNLSLIHIWYGSNVVGVPPPI